MEANRGAVYGMRSIGVGHNPVKITLFHEYDRTNGECYL